MKKERKIERGLSLIETMVAGALLMFCMGVMLRSLQAANAARAVEDAAGQTYRDCTVTLLRLSQELRGVRVLSPAAGAPAGNSLSYLKPRLVSDQVVVSSAGFPEWEGPFSCTLGGDLVVTTDPNGGFLGRLPDGELSFRRPRFDMLEIVVTARQQRQDRKGTAEQTFAVQISLDNQPGI